MLVLGWSLVLGVLGWFGAAAAQTVGAAAVAVEVGEAAASPWELLLLLLLV